MLDIQPEEVKIKHQIQTREKKTSEKFVCSGFCKFKRKYRMNLLILSSFYS